MEEGAPIHLQEQIQHMLVVEVVMDQVVVQMHLGAGGAGAGGGG